MLGEAPEIAQHRARGPIHDARPDRGWACRLELRRHGRQEFRLAALVDRRGQRAQHGHLFGAEGQRHEGVSADGDLTQGYPRSLDRNLRRGIFAPMLFWSVVRSLPRREAFAAERLRMDHGFEVFLPLERSAFGFTRILRFSHRRRILRAGIERGWLRLRRRQRRMFGLRPFAAKS